ncbi:sugar transferase [Sulfitobacter sp. G21635-S1]|uniref:sugar transferase n=1 Tax=Sulfitobacter sp. G21635-S1 TaxID=3014043 RepID=UPI0022AECDD2|nr:sugar transferase [Sulfitobacter sp. G21635-S1]MCZ4256143.1 sugar transferase [Sulfitobacter sp. G21635-S1]
MKKFQMDRPGYGLFDLGEQRSAAEGLMGRADLLTAEAASLWDAAIARKHAPAKPYRNGLKRVMDLALIVLTMPFWLPVIAACALALWIEGGQPFYRQQRLGRDGSRFSILKLRTMVRDADRVLQDLLATDPEIKAEWDALQKLRNDPRITPVGRFLRATSLDELPQLVNVLKGEMSLVGPRPMMPDQLGLYGNPRAYFAVRPGLTGLWQVSARNNNKFTYRHGVDEAYENALTFRLDLTILYKTVGVVLRQTGY